MSKVKYMIATVIVMLLSLAPTALAQSSKGIVVGNVADPSGAVLSGVQVKLTNKATGVSRETITTAEGSFRLDAVDPGTYKLEVVADGFKTFVLDEMPVAAAQITSNSNIRLEIGGKDEIIEVVDNSVILQTQDASRSNTLDSRQIVELPVASLNPVDLVFTLPGVSAPGPLAGGFVQGTEFSINGLRPRANNQLIDGTDNNDNSITGQAYQPVLRDGYQEVSILGGNNSAEYGRGGGAVANLITKSGTNQFHGSVYDVITPSALAALSSGEKINQGLKSKPVSIQNQYGFSIGGPVIKEKLFFFGTYQSSPFRSGGVTATAIVPTADGFAALRSLFPAGRSSNLDRYLSVVGDLRGVTQVRAVPLGGGRPNINFGLATRTGQTQPVDDHQFLTRVDWAASSKDSLSFRYLFDDQSFVNQFPTAFKGFEVDVPSRVQNLYMNHTHTFSPTLTNEFRFSYGRFNVLFAPPDQGAIDFGPQLNIATSGITAVGLAATFPQGRIFNNFQYQDTLTWTKGNHTIRAGADLTRQLAKQFVPFNNRGTLTFTTGGGFGAFGNFVDGFSGTSGAFGAKVFGSPVVYPNAFQQAYFINDAWRARTNLTINAGLRYENYGTPYNVVQFPAFAGFDVPISTVVKQKADNNNFAPRVGIAYTPRIWKRWFGEDKTVFRAGYGLSYDLFFNNILSNTAAASPNAFGANTFGTQGGTPRGFANAGPSNLPATGAPNPLTAITTIDPNLVNPINHVWNAGMQREVFGNIIVDVAYVGSRGIRLFQNQQLNPGINNVRIRNTRGPITSRTNSGDSVYHSLQTRVERGFKNGVFMRFTYTYSKAIDNVSEVFTTTGGSSFQSNPFNGRDDRGPSAFDATHRTVFTYIWDIPGPKKGIWYQVAGGWQVAGTYRLQSGSVESPFVGGFDLNRDLNAFNDRAAISNPNAPANSVAILGSLFGAGRGYVDANGDPIDPNNARYIVDPNVRTRIAGRNSFRGLRTNFTDFSVNKDFRLPWEGHKLQLRFEFFNAFNHAQFGVGAGDVTDPNFNNPFVNDGGNRTGRIQVRYQF